MARKKWDREQRRPKVHFVWRPGRSQTSEIGTCSIKCSRRVTIYSAPE